MLVKERYKLPEYIVAHLRSLSPHFGLGAFGETLFYTRYSREKEDGTNEDWCDVIIRCVEGVMSIRKDWYRKNKIEWDAEYWDSYVYGFAIAMYEMKFLPPGRGLWTMGTEFVYERGSMALQNCFSGTTKYVSNGEIKTLEETVGKTIKVMTYEGEKTASVKSFGEQQLFKLFFRHSKRSNHTLVFEATRNHRWLLSSGEETTRIRENDKILIRPGNVEKYTQEYNDGFVHGMVFADGNNHYKDKYNLSLFGWKENFTDVLKQSKLYSHETEKSGHILQSQIDLKKVPTNSSLEYKQGFFDSWSMFDGHNNPKSETLDTVSEEGTQWVVDHSGLLNYVVTGLSVDNNDTNYGKRTKPLNRISYVFESVEMFLKAILPSRTEEVFCVVEPDTHTFMLAGGIVTGNCGFKVVGKNIGSDANWCMDALMCGVGVGFEPQRDDELVLTRPVGTFRYLIPDSREGWCNSLSAIIDAYLVGGPEPEYDYSEVRPEGLIIKGFGGISSGPAPLKKLHIQVKSFLERYISDPTYDSVLLKADIINAIGCCVVAGNVRRSAEICCGRIDDEVFLDLKDYTKYPYRAEFGWMSNNSAILSEKRHYEKLGLIAKRVIANGEPGIINHRNMWKGRIGKKDNVPRDNAIGFNPCLRGNTNVLTSKGMKSIDKVESGDLIWSKSGWTRVLEVYANGVQPVYKCKTTFGEIELTEEHKVICDGLKTPMKIADVIELIPQDANVTSFTLDPSRVIAGLLIGDGSNYHGRSCLYVGQDDEDYFDSEIADYLTDLVPSDKVMYYVVSNIVSEELNPLPERVIPERFFRGDNITVRSFLRGLFSANGSICGSRITLKTTCFKLLQQVQLMLNSVGIRSYYTTNKSKEVEFANGTYRCKESYDLNIGDLESRKKFNALIGFIQDYKNEKLNSLLSSAKNSVNNNVEIVSKEYVGDFDVYDLLVDNESHTYWANGFNVSNCGEQPLEDGELCCLVETCPTRCVDADGVFDPYSWYKALEYATFYASTVTLLPTHRPETNKVMVRNRRIGVSIMDYANWVHDYQQSRVISCLREGYLVVRRFNKSFNSEAGIPEANRVTTIKPGGTVPKVVGVLSGMGNPNFHFMIRRVRMAMNSPMVQRLKDAGIPWEVDAYSANTLCFEFPVKQGPAKQMADVTLWEQAFTLMTLQAEWSDNAVSNTLTFKPAWVTVEKIRADNAKAIKAASTKYGIDIETGLSQHGSEYEFNGYRVKESWSDILVQKYNPHNEEGDIEKVLSSIVPHIKSLSLLPHCDEGVYVQMPEQGITEEEYNTRTAAIKPINWRGIANVKSEPELYCSGPACELPVKGV